MNGVTSEVRCAGDGSGNTIFHPLYWPYLDGNQRCQEPRFVVGQHIYHAYPQAKIILTLRHPTSRFLFFVCLGTHSFTALSALVGVVGLC